jgi:S-adenosylmethionine-diacylglycerol 3-amino-3-carboxypropyl transferase
MAICAWYGLLAGKAAKQTPTGHFAESVPIIVGTRCSIRGPKLGQFFRVVHGLARRMGRDPGQLLTAKTVAEQERIFDEQYSSLFDNRIVRWMGRQPVAVYSLGIPPSQHAAMLEEHNGDGSRLFDMYKQRLRRLVPITEIVWALLFEDGTWAEAQAHRRYREAHELQATSDALRRGVAQLGAHRGVLFAQTRYVALLGRRR